MLAWLTRHSLSAAIKVVAPKDVTKTAFDIVYTDDQGKDRSTTNKNGYYVAFRRYNNGVAGNWEFLKWNSKIGSYQQGYEVKFFSKPDRKTENQMIQFTVSNFNPNKNYEFDLGVFCDTNYDSEGDKVTLKSKFNGGSVLLQAKDGPIDRSMSLILGKNEFNNPVSSIFMGDMPGSEDVNPNNYPYTTNKVVKETNPDDDTVLAFSWQHQICEAGRIKICGFVAIVGGNYEIPPIVRDYTEVRTGYPQHFNLTFEVTEYDAQSVRLVINHINTGEIFECGSFISDGDKQVSKNFTCPIDMGQDFDYKYNAYAIDEDGYNSTIIEGKLLAQGLKPAWMNITTSPKKEYPPGGVIYVDGFIDDEEYAYVKYQFDDGEIFTYDQVFPTEEPGRQEFMVNIQIPSSLALNEIHNIDIWAADRFGLPSMIYSFEFDYSLPNKPYIVEVYSSREKVEANKKTRLIIFGIGTDPDFGQNVSIYLQFENEKPEKLGQFVSSNVMKPFAFFYQFPSKPIGLYTLTIYAQDESRKISEENKTLLVKVWDPEAPQPPSEIGKIVDVSSSTIKPGSNALFNLHYEDTDEIRRSMTFNDEGFFAAFRTYEGISTLSRRLGTYMIKYNEGSMKTADNFTVKFSTSTDKQTGFLNLEFKVTNNNYFSKKIDLCLFVDSDFSGNDNSPIKKRDDGRGLVISSSEQNIKYTVFTQDYFDSPPVNRYYLKDVERPSNGEIPEDQIPFFQNADGAEYSGENAMYGFSWMTQKIQGKSTVTYKIAVAAYDNVKTPTRLIDNTKLLDYYPSDQKNYLLNITIRDADIGERIKLQFNINNVLSNEIIQIKTRDTLFTKTIPIDSKYPTNVITINSVDEEEGARFPSNSITHYIHRTKPPVVTFENLKKRYHNKEPIVIAGTISSEGNYFKVFYQFTDTIAKGPEVELTKIDVITQNTQQFSANLSIPDEVFPRDYDWTITIWVEDDNGITSTSKSFNFNLNPFNPPVLLQAGLSKKVAKPNDKILSFAVFNDQENDFIDILVKIDNSEYPVVPTHRIATNYFPGEDQPVAFYWTVPNKTPAGIHDVTFVVQDAEQLRSKEITKTLYVSE